MAKSKIIIDLTSGQCSLPIALKRLYVILSDLGDKELHEWVKKELNGYDQNDAIPEYRTVRCVPTGSYETIGYGQIFSYKNRPLPMIDLNDDMKNKLTHENLRLSVEVLSHALQEYKNGKTIGMPLPMETWHIFQRGTNVTITGASLIIDESEIQRVLANVENKILDLLLFLEKKFGNLDELDMSVDDYEQSQLSEIAHDCKQIIFSNCSIQNFDNVKIKSKNMAVGDSKIDNKKTVTKNKNSNTGKGSNHVEKHTDFNVDTDITTEKEEKEKKGNWLSNLFHKRSK